MLKHLIFAAILFMFALDAWCLQRKLERGETVVRDDEERPVTKSDVLASRIFFFLVALTYLWGAYCGE